MRDRSQEPREIGCPGGHTCARGLEDTVSKPRQVGSGDVAIVDRYCLERQSARRRPKRSPRGAQSIVRRPSRSARSRVLQRGHEGNRMPPRLPLNWGVSSSVVEWRRSRSDLGPTRRSKAQHSRYIRFGHFTCQIDTGLELFEGRGVPRNCPLSLRQNEDSLRAERTLCSSLAPCRVLPIGS